MLVVPNWILRVLDIATQIGLVVAAGACAMAALAPWGTATLFHNVTLHIPGAVYQDGMYVLGASTTAILLHRSRIAGIAAAFVCRWAALQAGAEVPRAIIKNLAGAQMNLFPVNSVLDQAHLPELTIGNWSMPPASYLDYGIAAAVSAAQWLLVASLIGLIFDPLVIAAWKRYGAQPCRRCRKWIPVLRHADYCPRCGLWLPRAPEPLRCRACRNPLNASDNFCAVCGLAVALSPLEPVQV